MGGDVPLRTYTGLYGLIRAYTSLYAPLRAYTRGKNQVDYGTGAGNLSGLVSVSWKGRWRTVRHPVGLPPFFVFF